MNVGKRKPKPKSERVNITMRPMYYQKAEDIMAMTGENFSELLRRLVNEEYERSRRRSAPLQN